MNMINSTLDILSSPAQQTTYSNRLDINLSALSHNYRRMIERLDNNTQIVAIVKANAYGHGVFEVVNCAMREGITFFGVANFQEAIELRERFNDIKIIVLDVNFPSDTQMVYDYDLRPVVYSYQMIDALNEYGRRCGKKAKIHLKIDTGMGRIGVWHEHAIAFIENVMKYEFIQIEGVCSHFAASESNEQFSMEQLNSFLTIIDYFRTGGITFPYYHIANSAATFRLGVDSFNLVRIGIMGYGLTPRHHMTDNLGLKPVISWTSRVIFCKQVDAGRTIGYGSLYTTSRPTQIVTVPVGYADGYLRSLTNRGIVIIKGRRYPVVGRVAMDHFMVDVGADAHIDVGDEVVLAGRQGDAFISFEELADLAGTIPYEIVTGLGKRAYRNYFYSV